MKERQVPTLPGVPRRRTQGRDGVQSNLLVVLCGERGTQPIVNTGTLYSG